MHNSELRKYEEVLLKEEEKEKEAVQRQHQIKEILSGLEKLAEEMTPAPATPDEAREQVKQREATSIIADLLLTWKTKKTREEKKTRGERFGNIQKDDQRTLRGFRKWYHTLEQENKLPG